MKQALPHIFFKTYTWLAAALFFYLLSLAFSTPYTRQSVIGLERKNLEKYIQARQIEFKKFVADTALIYQLAGRSGAEGELKKITENTGGIFIFRQTPVGVNELLFWSNQYTYPPDKIHAMPDGEYFEHLDNGFYVCMKKTLQAAGSAEQLRVIGLIPVRYNYFVETDYLHDDFAHSKNAISRITLSGTPTEYPVSSLSGKTLFYIAAKAQPLIAHTGSLVVILKIAVILCLLLFIHFISEKTARKYGALRGISMLVISIVLFRLLSYYTSFPINFRQFELFDPAVYGSNPVHKSLGDLLINAVLFCWIVLYAWNKLAPAGRFSIVTGKYHFIAGTGCILIVLAFTFMMAGTIRSLAADSKISFDVINFFSLSQYTVFGFATLSVLAIGYYFFIRIMMLALAAYFHKNFYIVYLVIIIAGLSWLTFKIESPLLSFYMLVMMWLALYLRLLRVKRFAINQPHLKMAGTLFWIFLFSVSITAIIIEANRVKEWEIRKILAYRIYLQSDPYNERELRISFTYIDDDFLRQNFHRFRSEEPAKIFRDSILKKSSYLSRYDSRLYVFDENNKPLYNDAPESVNTLNTILRVQAKETNTPFLYYYETTFDKFTFIFKREVKNEAGKTIGSFFILSDPERYTADALYPELFRPANQVSPEESQTYTYGIYKKNILVPGPNNKYAFATTLMPEDVPEQQYDRRVRGSFIELWYKASNDKVVVIAKKRDSVIEAITLFSYIFCAFLFLVAFFNLLVLVLRVGGNLREIRQLLQWNIRTQVHSTIIFISILSFVIIGVATISFFIKRYEQNNRERLSRTMEIMVNEMEKKLDRRQVFDDQLAIYDSVANQEVQKLVNEVAEIHNVDVNVYDTSGNLHVSSQPIIYREGYLSKKIHPLAFYHLNRLRQVQHVQQEKLSNISYLSIYAPLRGNDGLAYAYLNIPYFLSQRELKQEISNFLVTIINLNAFIFLIAGVIALFITNRVTRSFSLISEKMKAVKLGGQNEEIIWNRNDEIGELVAEYNRMVKQLEKSADALARSEREGAWREMARQVAHEIKNPLTPMKLSIQYLQKSIDNNSGNVKDLTANVAKTLVEQIDHLSKIAFDFSQFANIGNTQPELIDLHEVLSSLGDLYRVNDNLELRLNMNNGDIRLYADKTQINRLFTNLFQNAVEACTTKDKCCIVINAVRNQSVVTVSVQDNGEGIPPDMQSKIFTPNFTTKTSGTGLGLAICKGIVEQAKGRIWFETKKGEGSTFFVELPLAN